MLRVAICGAGNWGTRLIESVQGRSAKIRFAAAVTRDPAARKPLGERFGLALSARYADVLEDPAIDAVVLAYLYRGVLLSQVGDRDRAQADLLTLRNLDAGLAERLARYLGGGMGREERDGIAPQFEVAY